MTAMCRPRRTFPFAASSATAASCKARGPERQSHRFHSYNRLHCAGGGLLLGSGLSSRTERGQRKRGRRQRMPKAVQEGHGLSISFYIFCEGGRTWDNGHSLLHQCTRQKRIHGAFHATPRFCERDNPSERVCQTWRIFV